MSIVCQCIQFLRSSFESRLSRCIGDLSGRSAMGRMITQLATSVNIENVTFSVKLSVSE